ncbi:CheR family methyltransferase [Cognatilysobacter terrigena]|uniref:CheR family methyltransferase n=1 Tax=Cognatilysobacter terrigena TaxID=2488749 RepID=UPI001AAD6755|nr:CheR family methyltransferase [Lysobacter terrigena]
MAEATRRRREDAPVGSALERTFEFDDRDFARICKLIHQRAGIALGPHKRDMVYSRLVRRLRAHGFSRFGDYLDFLEFRGDADEWQAFVNCLTTNLTSFFREAYHFDALITQLREAHARKPNGEPLRIWCAAASTGEEPWSLAITACEAFGTMTPPVRILATDIDTQVLETAERGVYTLDRIADLSEERKQAFFLRGSGPNAGQCRVKPALRDLVEFQPLNLLDSTYCVAPGLTAIFCRNVMIYFDKPTQYQVLSRMRPLLGAEGRLYAGHSESFHHAADLFTGCGRTIYMPRR